MCWTCVGEEMLERRVARVEIGAETARVAGMIKAFYDMPGCSSGGPLHTVLDDSNTDDDSIDFCVEHFDLWARSQDDLADFVTMGVRTQMLVLVGALRELDTVQRMLATVIWSMQPSDVSWALETDVALSPERGVTLVSRGVDFKTHDFDEVDEALERVPDETPLMEFAMDFMPVALRIDGSARREHGITLSPRETALVRRALALFFDATDAELIDRDSDNEGDTT